jgi:hypothetical protein
MSVTPRTYTFSTIRRRYFLRQENHTRLTRASSWVVPILDFLQRHRYDAPNDESLRELQRLFRDLDHEKQAAVNQARMMPWRG